MTPKLVNKVFSMKSTQIMSLQWNAIRNLITSQFGLINEVYVAVGVVTDRQTDTHTHTQNDYRNLTHAPMVNHVMPQYPKTHLNG